MSSETLVQRLDEAKTFLESQCSQFPQIVIVLGSGMANLLDSIELECEIPYSEIPHVKIPTVVGHKGQLLIGRLDGVRVACMQGRPHYYEGHPMTDVVFPFRLFAWAGGKTFLLTNAAGGLHFDMVPRELVLIRDHINQMGTNPLIGANVSELGTRFPDMTRLYDPELSNLIAQTAEELGIKLREGVYVAIHGPSYETPAEIRTFREIGGDVVGMSTVPEAIALHHMGKRVVAISFITNLAAGVSNQLLGHDEVIENAKKGYPDFSKLIRHCLKPIQQAMGG